MTFEEFKLRPEFAKQKAIYRFTGKFVSDLDLYLAYILKENIELGVEYIQQLLKSGEESDILRYDEALMIEFKDWGTALKYPEYSIFVTDMDELFRGYSQQSLDLGKFNTSNVENMKYMFADCKNLINLITDDERIKNEFRRLKRER